MRRPIGEGQGARLALIGVALAFLALMLLLPLVAVFSQALAKGAGAVIDGI